MSGITLFVMRILYILLLSFFIVSVKAQDQNTPYYQLINLKIQDENFFIEHTHSDEHYIKRALLKSKLDKYEDAIKDCDTAIKINSKNADYYFARAFLYEKLERYKEAIKDYRQGIKLNPTEAGAYNNKGAVNKKLGNNKKAIKDYKNAITINPNYAEAYNNMGIAEDDAKKYTQAIKGKPPLHPVLT